MKGWRVVKVTLACVLAAANVFMLGFLYSVFRPLEYIPEDAIRQMRELLRKDGILIPQGVVDGRKIDLPIYEGTMPQDYYTVTASKLSRSGVSLTFDAPNGMVVSMANGARCAFYDGFGIRYTAANAPEHHVLSTLNVTALSPPSPADMETAREVIDLFLDGVSTPNAAFPYTVVTCAEDMDSGIRYCVCEQEMGGRSLMDFRTVFAVQDSRVIGMSGSWCFASIGASYSAQLLDQINILYSVRNRILEERASTADDRVEIESLELGYAVYFRGDTENFYLIPAWNVQTDAGENYCINAVDGTLYTK